MNDFSNRVPGLLGVTNIKSLQQLCEYLPYNIFSHVILILLALLDQLSHISTLAILHHYIYLSRLFLNYSESLGKMELLNDLLVIVSHNVGMIQMTEYIDLIYDLLAFLFVQFSIIKLLPYQQSAIRLSSYLEDRPVAS